LLPAARGSISLLAWWLPSASTGGWNALSHSLPSITAPRVTIVNYSSIIYGFHFGEFRKISWQEPNFITQTQKMLLTFMWWPSSPNILTY
jgi:hypothetical protein